MLEFRLEGEKVAIVLDRKQHQLWEQALTAAEEEVGGARNPKARTLELLTERYLANCEKHEPS